MKKNKFRAFWHHMLVSDHEMALCTIKDYEFEDLEIKVVSDEYIEFSTYTSWGEVYDALESSGFTDLFTL